MNAATTDGGITQEQYDRNVLTIQAQTGELGQAHFALRVTCGGCGQKVRLWRAYRCYYCGIYFCEQCAAVHFGGERPKLLAAELEIQAQA